MSKRENQLEDCLYRAVGSELALLRAITPVHEAVSQAADFMEENWNDLAHVEITLSIRECRAIRRAIEQAALPKPELDQ